MPKPRGTKRTMRRPARPKKRMRMTVSRRVGYSVYSQAKPHFFKRSTGLFSITGDNVAPNQTGGRTFSLADLPNISDFTTLFDQYKFLGIKLIFTSVRSYANATSTGIQPLMFITVDRDTSTAPSTANEIREYASCKMWRFSDNGKPFTMFFKPTVLNEVYRSAVATATAPQRAPWLSTSFVDAAHFGIRWVVNDIQSNAYTINCQAVYYFAMKNLR